MTITVTNIVAGPFVASGAAQDLPFAFKVFTPAECEVVIGDQVNGDRLTLTTDYTVFINKQIDNQVMEGGSVSLFAGRVASGQSVYVIAKPYMTQEQTYSNTGTRMTNINEGLDRSALRALRASYDGALEGAGLELIEAAKAAGAEAAKASVGINMGVWDAQANLPVIRSGVGIAGQWFTVGTAGTTSLDGVSAWSVGDQARFDGVVWTRIPGSAGGTNRGQWNAATNTPELKRGVGTEGDFYIVTVEGSRDIEAPAPPPALPVSWKYGDQVRFVSGAWVKSSTSMTARDLAYYLAGVKKTDDLSVLEFLRETANPVPDLVGIRPYNAEALVDSGPELQKLLNLARDLKLPEVKLLKNYYLTTPVTVPQDVKIVGVSGGGEEVDKTANASKTRMSAIICSGTGRLHFAARAGAERIAMIKASELTPPATLAQALATQAARSGTAMNVLHAPDVTIRDCYIVGFNLGVDCDTSERWNIESNKIDCTNGIRTSMTFDVGRCHNNHIWPFWPTHITFPDGDALKAYTRDGYAIMSEGPNDGCLYTNNLTFGYRYGGLIKVLAGNTGSNYANKWRGNWFDNSASPWDGELTYGIRLEGDVRLCTIEDNHFDQMGVSLDMLATPGTQGRTPNIATGNTFGLSTHRWIRCGPGSGVINGVVAGGGTGLYGIEFLPGCGVWMVDNVIASDSTNQEGPGDSGLFTFTGSDLPNITMGAAVAYGGIVHNAFAFGTIVAADRNGIPYNYTSTNLEVEVAFPRKTNDALGEFDASNNVFTATVAGMYTLSGNIGFTTSSMTPTSYGVYLYTQRVGGSWTKVKTLTQGVTTTAGGYANSWSTTEVGPAGCKFKIQFVYGANCTIVGDVNVTNFSAYRLPRARG